MGIFGPSLAKVCDTMSGNTRVASAQTLTGFASILIFPHEIASSGLAPESEPSNSCGMKGRAHATRLGVRQAN